MLGHFKSPLPPLMFPPCPPSPLPPPPLMPPFARPHLSMQAVFGVLALLLVFDHGLEARHFSLKLLPLLLPLQGLLLQGSKIHKNNVFRTYKILVYFHISSLENITARNAMYIEGKSRGAGKGEGGRMPTPLILFIKCSCIKCSGKDQDN